MIEVFDIIIQLHVCSYDADDSITKKEVINKKN